MSILERYFINKNKDYTINYLEREIYKYMNDIPIFENYNIFNIEELDKIAQENNNLLSYNFNYEVSQILITLQKDLKYRNKLSILNNLNIIDNVKKIIFDYNKYNLNTNNLKYFLYSNKLINNDEYNKFSILIGNDIFKIIKSGFINIITTNQNDNNNYENNHKLIYSAYLGFKFFNKLKKYFPTFSYTYCYMRCTKIVDGFNNNIYNWCNKTDKNSNLVPYVMYESDLFNHNIFIEFNSGIYNNDMYKKSIITQILSIKNYLDDDENLKNIVLNLEIKNVYIKILDKDYKFPFYNKQGQILYYFETKYILHIPIISRNNNEFIFEGKRIYKVNDLIEEITKDSNNENKPESLNIIEINNYETNLHENNILNKYKYNIIPNNKDKNDKKIDIKLTKFVSEYCLNDIKYMNNDSKNYIINKNNIEKDFIELINNKIYNLNIKIDNENIIKIYNKYVKFIDILVKAKCLDYRETLYKIFEFKIKLAEEIYKIDTEVIGDDEKDNMIYTIEKSYKDLPNSNYFLNFISQIPLVDIIINAFIYYLFINTVILMYINYQAVNKYNKIQKLMEISGENMNMDQIFELLHGINYIDNLLNTYYKYNIIHTLYVKLYEYGFINIIPHFTKLMFIIPLVYKILNTCLEVKNNTNRDIDIYNKMIDGINKLLFGNNFLRFKIKNLLSYNFPSMIRFLWNDYIGKTDENYIIVKKNDIASIKNNLTTVFKYDDIPDFL